MNQMVKHPNVEIKPIVYQTINVWPKKIVYKTEIETSNGINKLSTKVCFGISKRECKSRYNNHTMLQIAINQNDTKLSKYICSLKDQK